MTQVIEWTRGPRVLSGAGAVERIGGEATALTGREAPLLLVSDPGVAPLARRLQELLEAAGHPVAVFAEITSDPKAGQVDAAAALARRTGARAVVGLGGGSGLDVAKLAAAVAGAEASVLSYGLGAASFPAGALPVLAVPTTSGTGAEATRVAIFSRDDGAKLWAWGPELLPQVAILDPEMTVGLPAPLTAATGIDALVHAVEAATNRHANSFSQAPALEAVRLVAGKLRRAVVQGDDLEARGQVQLAAFLAGQAIDAAGTGVAHALGHALGSLGRVHHGRAVGLSLGVALAANAEASPQAHAAVARALGLDGADGAALGGLPAAYDRLLDEVGLDRDLAPLGLDPAVLAAETMKPENAPMLASNCRSYGAEELTGFCRSLLEAR
jgi:alcohol dehydrogenase class IV